MPTSTPVLPIREFDLGDLAYPVIERTIMTNEKCPACNGENKLSIVAQDGNTYQFICPVCNNGYINQVDSKLWEVASPVTIKGMDIIDTYTNTSRDIIAQIIYHTTRGRHNDFDLFATEEAATRECDLRNSLHKTQTM